MKGDVCLPLKDQNFRELKDMQAIKGTSRELRSFNFHPRCRLAGSRDHHWPDPRKPTALFSNLYHESPLFITFRADPNIECQRKTIRDKPTPNVSPKGGDQNDLIDPELLAKIDLKRDLLLRVRKSRRAIPDGAHPAVQTHLSKRAQLRVNGLELSLQFRNGSRFGTSSRAGLHDRNEECREKMMRKKASHDEGLIVVSS